METLVVDAFVNNPELILIPLVIPKFPVKETLMVNFERGVVV